MTNLSFYDTAAGLIPVLLLGGLLSERVRGVTLESRWALPALLLLGLFAPLSELFAIDAALSDSPSAFEKVVVVSAVAIGTWGLATAAIWQILGPLWAHSRAARVSLGVGYALLVVTGAFLLASASGLEKSKQDLEKSNNRLRESEADLGAGSGSGSGSGALGDLLRLLEAQDQETDAEFAAGKITRREAGVIKLDRARMRIEALELVRKP